MRQEARENPGGSAGVFPDGGVAFPARHRSTGRRVLWRGQIRIGPHDAICQIACTSKEGLVLGEVRELQPVRPGLAVPKKVTGASQLEIAFGEAEAVVGIAQGSKPCLGFGRQRFAKREQARAPLTRPAHAPPELMKLGEPKALGLLDDDDVCRRDVDPDLQHRGAHQHLQLALHERAHQRTSLVAGKAAMDLSDAVVSELPFHFGEGSVDTHELVRR